MNRIKILKIYLWIVAVFTSFWWPLSHWFYSEWYHGLLGFDSYPVALDDSMVKIIGTCGIVPCALLFFAAIDPVKNRDMIKTVIIYAVCMIATYIYLIKTHSFPEKEYINVILLTVNIILLSLLFPRDVASIDK